MYLSDNKAVKMNPEKYDVQDFQKAEKNYLTTGNYPTDALRPAPIDLNKWAKEQKVTGQVENTVARDLPDGNVFKQTIQTNPGAKGKIIARAVTDPTGQVIHSIEKNWATLSPSIQKQYLKQYPSLAEAQMNWFGDTYSQSMLGAENKISTENAPKKAGGLFVLGFGGAKGPGVLPEQPNLVLDGYTFDHYFPIQKDIKGAVINNLKVIDPQTGKLVSSPQDKQSEYSVIGFAPQNGVDGNQVILKKKFPAGNMYDTKTFVAPLDGNDFLVNDKINLSGIEQGARMTITQDKSRDNGGQILNTPTKSGKVHIKGF
jgi:hypothetical protein